MEQGEGQQSQFIELEASEFLESGQNFYNQPPFSTILSDVSIKTGAEIQVLRLMMSRLRGKLKSYDPEEKGKIFNSQHLVKLMQKSGVSSLVIYGVGTKPEIQRRAIPLIGKGLENYPFWYEYINTQFPDSFYLPDGSRNPNNPRPVVVKSYAAWVDRKLKTEPNLVLKGIEEIFPQDFAGQTPLVPTLSGDAATGRQKWRLLTASELVRVK